MIVLHRRTDGRASSCSCPTCSEEDRSLAGVPHQGGYGTLGHYWGLMEQADGQREDGSNRVGWWRLTMLGQEFVMRRTTVPQYARVYNGRCLGLVGDPVDIRTALGTKFNYDDLMRGV